MSAVRVGVRQIGGGAPCFVAAEAGLNHNGDLALAHRLIEAAADAGADGVKFQNYRTEDFLQDTSLMYEYDSGGETVVESQFQMFKRYELPASALAELCAHCAERDVTFFSTPTSEEGVEELVRAGATLLKNGSDYLLNLDLVRAMARSGLPTVLSTGMATLDEVDTAVGAFRDAGGSELVLLHCTSAYPTPPDEVHLRKLATLRARYGCPVGLSDHTDGIVAAVASAALGSAFLEKHFTLDRSLAGPDHRFSADPAELRALVAAVRLAERALGDAEVGPTAAELVARSGYRLSCVAAQALPAGHRLERSDVAFRRPGDGIAPPEADRLAGRVLVHAVAAGHVFGGEDLV